MNAILTWTTLRCLMLYRRWLSLLLPDACRYSPTCSGYAVTAVTRYGIWRGGWMALWRILRCHPGRPGGFDPVP